MCASLHTDMPGLPVHAPYPFIYWKTALRIIAVSLRRKAFHDIITKFVPSEQRMMPRAHHPFAGCARFFSAHLVSIQARRRPAQSFEA
jgi:hypothetical protein